MFRKKLLSRGVVELALFLTFLYDSNYGRWDYEGTQDAGTHFRDEGQWNDSRGGSVVGSTYSPRPHIQELTHHLWSKDLEQSSPDDWPHVDEANYYRERVLDELRRLSVLRYSEPPSTPMKDLPLQHFTAFVLDETQETLRPTLLDPPSPFSAPPDMDVGLLEEMEALSQSYDFQLSPSVAYSPLGDEDEGLLDHLVSGHLDVCDEGVKDGCGEEEMNVMSSCQLHATDDLWDRDSGIFDSPRTLSGDEDSDEGGATPPSSHHSNAHLDLDMLQTHPAQRPTHPPLHPPQPRFQVHGLMSGMRGMGGSMDRYQEMPAFGFLPPDPPTHFPPSYLTHPFQPQPHCPTSAPFSYADAPRSALLHNATLPQLNLSTATYPPIDIGPSSSMHLLNHHETDTGTTYNKLLDTNQETIFFQGGGGELANHTNDGILTSFMNDEAMQLMEMQLMNDGLYAMRMMDGPPNPPQHLPSYDNEDRLDASSDSAVSSMGSERVRPLLEPNMLAEEWPQTEQPPFPNNFNTDKLRPYDYFKDEGRQRVVAPVAQKKHQMFGKRPVGPPPFSPPRTATLHPQPTHSKYTLFPRHECASEHVNHTYALPPTHPDHPNMTARTQRGTPKEKPKKEQMSRDDKKAQLLGLPLSTDQIVNLPMDEFNERLSKHDLSETQLSLIRDIRRRGKNKVAAQNCRKRKIDQITQLENEVTVIRHKKESLLRENGNLLGRRSAITEKYSFLYQHVFQSLRSEDGRPYDSTLWSLVHGPDGNCRLMRTQSNTSTVPYTPEEEPSFGRRGRNPTKGKEDKKGGR